MLNNSKYLLIASLALLTANLSAKGLNDISKDPLPEAQKEVMPAVETQKEVIPAVETQNTMSEEDKKKAAEKEIADEKKKTEEAKKAEEAKVFKQSPEEINNKLSLATSLNYATMTARAGEWSSTFLSEIIATYNFKNPYEHDLTWGLTLRYTPFKALAKDSAKAVELTGVVSGYNFGAVFNKSFKKKILLSVNLEGGYFDANLNPTAASGNTSNSLEESGFGFTTGITGSYLLLDKIALGYKLSYTIGRLNIFQTGLNFNFIF